MMVISEYLWHSHVLPTVWQLSFHCLFLRLRSVAAGIWTTNLQLHCAIVVVKCNFKMFFTHIVLQSRDSTNSILKYLRILHFYDNLYLLYLLKFEMIRLHIFIISCRVFWDGGLYSYSDSGNDISKWTNACVSTHHNKRRRWIQRKLRRVHGTTGRRLRIFL